jgi:hypothetical protein
VCPVCKATVELTAGQSGLKCVRVPSRLSGSRRHSGDAGGRGENRRIDAVPNVLESLPRGGRVAIVRLRSLGDCVLTTPALDLLKRARPDLRVADGGSALPRYIRGNPDVEDILAARLARCAAGGRRLCLNLHGGTRSAFLTAGFGRPLSRRLRALPLPVRVQRRTSRGRRKFWASSAPCIRPNIWLARCSIWARPWWRFRAREA